MLVAWLFALALTGAPLIFVAKLWTAAPKGGAQFCGCGRGPNPMRRVGRECAAGGALLHRWGWRAFECGECRRIQLRRVAQAVRAPRLRGRVGPALPGAADAQLSIEPC